MSEKYGYDEQLGGIYELLYDQNILLKKQNMMLADQVELLSQLVDMTGSKILRKEELDGKI